MNVCICDDDILIHGKIENLVKENYFDESNINIECFSSGGRLLEALSDDKGYDIYFLDIELPDINGLDVAERIRALQHNAIIIFVSSHEQYVYDVFRLEALHFIRKPVDEVEFKEVFTRTISKYKLMHSKLDLKWRAKRFSIVVNDIVYVEGYGRHIFVHTKDDEWEAIGKINDILDILEPHGFIKTHQGFVVNMDYIKRFDTAEVVLQNEKKIPVSIHRRNEALRLYDSYLQKRKW